MTDLAELAAAIARHVDRLVIAVHRRVFTDYRDVIDSLVEPLGLPAPGHLFDLAEFILQGEFTRDLARSRFRYEADGFIDEAVDNWLRARVITSNGRPHATVRVVLERILEARAQVAETLWNNNDLEMTSSGADAALLAAVGPLVEHFRRLAEPSSPPHRLHHMLTGVRYARVDAHHRAWSSHGLSSAEIVTLPTGPLRTQIESETNQNCTHFLQAISNPTEWFIALTHLPS